ncbi:MAG: serine/threonine protein kinase, partial [bacterium]
MPYPFDHDTRHGRRPNEHDSLIGTTLDGRFLIEQRIATGGFGAIYRARLPSGDAIALKVLHPRLASDPTMVARFRREGAILTKLHDPHTVTTLAVGEVAGGTLYIAMELLSGETLQDHLHRSGALPWQTAVAIARAVCSSLAEAHALGVVHRDLKPANIHVDSRGGAVQIVKVIDFGIVKVARGSAIDDGNDLTNAGHMIGTYDYMSPEQLLGAECSAASDLYSLGLVTYEMLTGRRPYPKVTSPASMMTAIVTQTPLRPSLLAAIPPELDGIVMRCLEREPGARFAGVAELAHELDRLLATRVAAHDEATVLQPTWPTMREERIWLESRGDAIVDDLADAGLEDPSPLAPWTLPMADAFGGPAVTEPPPPPIATGTARGSRPKHGTLPGVAVAPESRSKLDVAAPPPAPSAPERAYVREERLPPVPMPPLRPWLLPPLIPERPAVRAAPPPQERARALWWIALAIL